MSLFLTTSDAGVIETIHANRAGIKNLHDRARAWAAERGFDHYFMNGFAGKFYATGLPGIPEGHGRWTKPTQRGVCRPYQNNEPEVAALNALRFSASNVPGLPGAVISVPQRDGATFLMDPSPFVHEDRAWVAYPHQPEESARALFGTQWEECLASRFHAAHEARMAAQHAAAAALEDPR